MGTISPVCVTAWKVVSAATGTVRTARAGSGRAASSLQADRTAIASKAPSINDLLSGMTAPKI